MKHSTKKQNLAGLRFGRLLVIEEAPKNGKKTAWYCLCDCGLKKSFISTHLVSGKSKSCGCLRKELLTSHGHNTKLGRTSEYCAWDAMLQRCYNPKNSNYENYGARGITVCKRWREAFINFFKDMGAKPLSILTLERVNNEKGYSPTNCRWASYSDQNKNRRPNARFRTAPG